MTLHDPCSKLVGRTRQAICRGETTVSAENRHSYMQAWIASGELDASALSDSGGTALPVPKKSNKPKKRPCGGCRKRKAFVNRVVPGAGNVVEKMAKITGLKNLADSMAEWKEVKDYSGSPPRYVTTAQLVEDTLSLIPRLPDDITAVVGVARSGMLSATLFAMHLHRPLYSLSKQTGVLECGSGWRLEVSEKLPSHFSGRVLVVDDTVMSGYSLRASRETSTKKIGNPFFINIYVNPKSKERPDLFAAWLPAPHLLEWNLFNGFYLQCSAFDFDGVLCRDIESWEDDDGEAYSEAIATRPALVYPRKRPINIVTARLEKYREPTLRWLAENGIPVDNLIMGPWSDKTKRSGKDIGTWKGEKVKELFHKMKINPTFGGPFFVESDPSQAQRIAQVSRRLVVCPSAGKCFQ